MNFQSDWDQAEPSAKRIKFEVDPPNIPHGFSNSAEFTGSRVHDQVAIHVDNINRLENPWAQSDGFDEDFVSTTEDELPPLDLDEVEEFIRALQGAEDADSCKPQVQGSELEGRERGEPTTKPSQLPQPSLSTTSNRCLFKWDTFTLKPIEATSSSIVKKRGRKRKQPLENISFITPPSTKFRLRTTRKQQNTHHFETPEPLQQLQEVDEKSFKCDYCPKSFQSMDSLKRHQKIHTEPYECPECLKGFSTKLCRDDHIRHVHTGERPFACATCGKRFLSHANLWQHSQLHTGLKAYACETCGARFRQSSGLTGHFRKFRGTCASQK